MIFGLNTSIKLFELLNFTPMITIINVLNIVSRNFELPNLGVQAVIFRAGKVSCNKGTSIAFHL